MRQKLQRFLSVLFLFQLTRYPFFEPLTVIYEEGFFFPTRTIVVSALQRTRVIHKQHRALTDDLCTCRQPVIERHALVHAYAA